MIDGFLGITIVGISRQDGVCIHQLAVHTSLQTHLIVLFLTVLIGYDRLILLCSKQVFALCCQLTGILIGGFGRFVSITDEGVNLGGLTILFGGIQGVGLVGSAVNCLIFSVAVTAQGNKLIVCVVIVTGSSCSLCSSIHGRIIRRMGLIGIAQRSIYSICVSIGARVVQLICLGLGGQRLAVAVVTQCIVDGNGLVILAFGGQRCGLQVLALLDLLRGITITTKSGESSNGIIILSGGLQGHRISIHRGITIRVALIGFAQRGIHSIGLRVGSSIVELIRQGLRSKIPAVAITIQFVKECDRRIITARCRQRLCLAIAALVHHGISFIVLAEKGKRRGSIVIAAICQQRFGGGVHFCIISVMRLIGFRQGSIGLPGIRIAAILVLHISSHLSEEVLAVLIVFQTDEQLCSVVPIVRSHQSTGFAVGGLVDLRLAVAVIPQLGEGRNGFIIAAAIHQRHSIIVHGYKIVRMILICSGQGSIVIANRIILTGSKSLVRLRLLDTVATVLIVTQLSECGNSRIILAVLQYLDRVIIVHLG